MLIVSGRSRAPAYVAVGTPGDVPNYTGVAQTLVYSDNMDAYTSPSQMWTDYNASPGTPIIHPQEEPLHPGWEIITPGRGGSGKALRVNFTGNQQEGAAWITNSSGSAAPASSVTYMTWYGRVIFSSPMGPTQALGVKWFEGVHPGANRIQWQYQSSPGDCGDEIRNTFSQIMDESVSSGCQSLQPIPPWIEDIDGAGWLKFAYAYVSNTTAGARNGLARCWVQHPSTGVMTKITDCSLAAVGVTPPGGFREYCTLQNVDDLTANKAISNLKWGDIQTTTTPAWTMDVDDLFWWYGAIA